jgi:hypothetical protein
MVQLNDQTILEYLNPNLTKTYGEKFNGRGGEYDRPKLLASGKFDVLSSGRLWGCRVKNQATRAYRASALANKAVISSSVAMSKSLIELACSSMFRTD